MNFKISKKTVSEPRRTNAIGWTRRRGGAGSVACALAVSALLLCLVFSATAESKIIQPSGSGESSIPSDTPNVTPWEKPAADQSAPSYNGATPSRLRW